MKNYMDVIGSSHMELDKKEMTKLNKITDDEGFIDRGEFLEYARKSSAVKEFTERGACGPGTGKTTSCKINKNMDKAELAFRVSYILFVITFL